MKAITPRLEKKISHRFVKDSLEIKMLTKTISSQVIEEATSRAKSHYEHVLQHAASQGRAEAAAVLAETLAFRNQSIRSNRNFLISLAISIAEEVIGEASAIHPETIVNRIERAINSIIQANHAVIAINPEDLPRLEKHLPALAPLGANPIALSLRTDSTIPIGDALIETSFGTISASLQAHIQAIRSRLTDSTSEKCKATERSNVSK